LHPSYRRRSARAGILQRDAQRAVAAVAPPVPACACPRGVLPEIVVETPSATTTSAIVTRRMRFGVSHGILILASQARAPLAPAPAVIAPIMH
jgi:hypothetical protein